MRQQAGGAASWRPAHENGSQGAEGPQVHFSLYRNLCKLPKGAALCSAAGAAAANPRETAPTLPALRKHHGGTLV